MRALLLISIKHCDDGQLLCRQDRKKKRNVVSKVSSSYVLFNRWSRKAFVEHPIWRSLCRKGPQRKWSGRISWLEWWIVPQQMMPWIASPFHSLFFYVSFSLYLSAKGLPFWWTLTQTGKSTRRKKSCPFLALKLCATQRFVIIVVTILNNGHLSRTSVCDVRLWILHAWFYHVSKCAMFFWLNKRYVYWLV